MCTILAKSNSLVNSDEKRHHMSPEVNELETQKENTWLRAQRRLKVIVMWCIGTSHYTFSLWLDTGYIRVCLPLIILVVVLMNVKLPQSPKIYVRKTFWWVFYLVFFQYSRNCNEEIKSFFIDSRSTVPKAFMIWYPLGKSIYLVSDSYLIFWKIAFSG